ncbi:MAG: hypothetical protein V1834_01180 [Candidatus Micrarchaeota archaeon]
MHEVRKELERLQEELGGISLSSIHLNEREGKGHLAVASVVEVDEGNLNAQTLAVRIRAVFANGPRDLMHRFSFTQDDQGQINGYRLHVSTLSPEFSKVASALKKHGVDYQVHEDHFLVPAQSIEAFPVGLGSALLRLKRDGLEVGVNIVSEPNFEESILALRGFKLVPKK